MKSLQLKKQTQPRHDPTNVLLQRMARALISTYAINQQLSLAIVLKVSPMLTNEQAVSHWIKESLNQVDLELADAVFGTLCTRFERCLSHLPESTRGALQ